MTNVITQDQIEKLLAETSELLRESEVLILKTKQLLRRSEQESGSADKDLVRALGHIIGE